MNHVGVYGFNNCGIWVRKKCDKMKKNEEEKGYKRRKVGYYLRKNWEKICKN